MGCSVSISDEVIGTFSVLQRLHMIRVLHMVCGICLNTVCATFLLSIITVCHAECKSAAEYNNI